MSDTSLRARLRKLFSKGAVVRVIGKNKLKVVDVDRLQMRDRDTYVQKYRGIYAKNAGRYSESYGSLYSNRLGLFREYESMDSDAIISSALDIYSDEATAMDEYGDVLKIESNDDNIKKILYNLFYDIMNIEFNLWPWVRNMCKYGDTFLYLDIDKDVGIVNVIPLSVYSVERIEGIGDNPYEVRFKYEGDGMFPGMATDSPELDNYQIAHFRLLSDGNFVPYGKPILENARRIWKQLSLMEDAMLIHRIMRAPDKRVFKVDVGNVDPNSVDAYMESLHNKISKVPLVDPVTGDYNLQFNMQNLVEDFFIPVRGSDSGTDIQNLPGLEYQAIEDIDYLKNKLFAALRIPKAYLNFEEDLSGKATLAAEDLRFAKTIQRVQKIVVSELTKIALIHLYIQGFTDQDLVNFELTLTTPSTVFEQEKIRIWQEKVALADSIRNNKMLPEDWIYKNVYNISDNEIITMKEQVVGDHKFTWRLNQIEVEGNDPKKSGQRVDGGVIVNPFAEQQDPMQEGQPDGEVNYDDDKFKQGGRPKENSTKYATDKHAMGRDPIGQKSLSEVERVKREILNGGIIKNLDALFEDNSPEE